VLNDAQVFTGGVQVPIAKVEHRFLARKNFEATDWSEKRTHVIEMHL
jgi:hypothetical protein